MNIERVEDAENPLDELRIILRQFGGLAPQWLVDNLQCWADKYVHCYEVKTEIYPLREIGAEEDGYLRSNMAKQLASKLADIAEFEVDRGKLVESRIARVWLLYNRSNERDVS